MSRKPVILSLVLALAIPLSVPAADVLVVKAGKIYTATGAVIEDGTILIENGKIAAIGKNISVPGKAKVVRAQVVIPGLVDIHSHLGVYSMPAIEENADGNEMTNPVTPQVRALDSFNFEDPAIPAGRAGGVTTIVALPGSGNVVGGAGVALKLKSGPPEGMILEEIAVLKMAIEGNPVGAYGRKNQMPMTLMGVYHLARKAFLDAREYQAGWETYAKDKKDGKDAALPKRDLGKEIMVRALKREIPVHIHCATASEVLSCIRLAEEFNLRLSLAHCYWAYLVVDELGKHKDVHFNVGPPMFFSYFDDPREFRNCAAILARAGLNVSLHTDAIGGVQQNLRELAALCVRYGMSEEDALKAVTIRGAQAAGLDDRVGSLEAGKDADLVLLDGEPFELLTNVEKVIIDGKVEHDAPSLKAAGGLPASAPAAGSLAVPPEIASAARYALKGGTVYTMAGAPLRNATILVEGGKIAEVGAGVSVPPGVPVVDAGEFVILPGLVEPRSYVGISGNWRSQSSVDEASSPVTPEMEIRHALEPQAPLFAFIRQIGVTTALVTPGDRNVIGGRGAVIKTAGDAADKMIVKDKAVMTMGFGPSAKRDGQMPSTRMGLAALLRENLVKAQEYRDKVDAYAKDKKGAPPQKDLAMEALLPVIRGETPALVHAEREDDIRTALRIADEFKLKLILDGATDAGKLAGELKKRDIPVIIENLMRGVGQIEDRGFDPRMPAVLAKAGVRIAFRPEEGSWYTPGLGNGGGDLLELAAFAVRNGLPEEAALRALTIDAARIIGYDSGAGSLEPGKDADFLILRGHPFATRSIPEAVIVAGKIVYRRTDGEHLRSSR